MYCSKCGKEMDEKAVFCSSCGKKVGSSVQQQEKELVNSGFEIRFTEQETKWLILKIIYIILVCFVWYQAQKEMFDIDGYMGLSIENLMENVIDEKQYLDESTLIARLCYWSFRIGLIGYILAAALALLQKEDVAQTLSIWSFVCQLPIFAYTIKGVMIVYNRAYLADAMRVVNEEFWIYLVLNIFVFICGYCFFNNISVAKRYRRKSYTILNGNMNEVKMPGTGEWRCIDCGKIHANYVHTCSCGYNRDSNV